MNVKKAVSGGGPIVTCDTMANSPLSLTSIFDICAAPDTTLLYGV